MPSPFFSGRIPQNLFDKAEEFIKESGKTKTEILIEALAVYLQCPVEAKKPIGNEDIWGEIAELKERVKALEKSHPQELVVTNSSNQIREEIREEVKQDSNQLCILEIKELAAKIKGKILKTNEIPDLPGLAGMSRQKILNKLRNTKAGGHKTVKIGSYVFTLASQEPGAKGALIWEVREV